MGDFPQNATDMLPLCAEPMFQWKKDTDIRVFAQTLYADDRVTSFGFETCAEYEKEMREQARAFTKTLMESRHSSIYIDFYQDAQFGQVAKYAIALKCCIITRWWQDRGKACWSGRDSVNRTLSPATSNSQAVMCGTR